MRDFEKIAFARINDVTNDINDQWLRIYSAFQDKDRKYLQSQKRIS